MRFYQFASPIVLTIATVLMTGSTAAAQLKPNQSYFTHPPELIRTNAIYKSSRTPSTYEFTIAVPADAGAPLSAVTIVQDRNLETVRFNLPKSQAFVGKHYAAGPMIPLASLGGEAEPPGMATIVFAQPVQPGSTITVAVDVAANPSMGGVYEFGVTAYPSNQDGLGQFLGYGRINFYGRN
jgi:Protein of unknown function (DUF2808)